MYSPEQHHLNNLPQLDLIQFLNSRNNVSHLDPDLNIPSQSNFQYYTTDEFQTNDIINECISSDHFSCLHSNIRSLNSNFDNLIQMLSEFSYNFSVIGLTETRLKTTQENLCNQYLNGYTFVSQPSLSNAGGVGFFINDSLCYNVRHDLSEIVAGYETLWIEIQSSLINQNIICGVIYRHPHSDISTFMTYLNNTLDRINNERKLCVLMGDFNLNLLNWDSHSPTEELLNTLGTYFYNPHILQPTRITHHSATLIDNIFLNSISHHTISGNVVYDLSDHLPNFLILNNFSTLPKNFELFRRDYSNFNELNFLQDIQAADWTNNPTNNDVNLLFDSFYDKLSNIVDKHIPDKKMSKREIKFLSKPSITFGIRKSLKIKNNIYKKFIKSQSVYYHSKFKLYRNKLNHLIRISKINYYNNYFRHNKSHINNIWKGIKEIISFKPLRNSIPSKVVVDNNAITDTYSIANSFNAFFTNIGNNLANNIPATSASPLSFMPASRQSNSFFLNSISVNEIAEEISNLNTSKSSGPFSVPVKILKLIKEHISIPLATIFNCSISSSTLPDKFMIASVIPVHKQGSQLIPNNYRPISLLSIFNGLLERLVCRRLIKDFITKHNLLYEKKLDFRSNHSTLHAVLSIIDKIQNAIEDGNYSCGIFLDLSKAFDTVNHQILLQKLEYYGIRGMANDWFKSYLDNRKQFVSMGGVKSDMLGITCGVPQV